MVRLRHSSHITEGLLDPLEDAGDTATQNTNHHRGHPHLAHTILKHPPVPNKYSRHHRNPNEITRIHNKSKFTMKTHMKLQQVQQTPCFYMFPFDSGPDKKGSGLRPAVCLPFLCCSLLPLPLGFPVGASVVGVSMHSLLFSYIYLAYPNIFG